MATKLKGKSHSIAYKEDRIVVDFDEYGRKWEFKTGEDLSAISPKIRECAEFGGSFTPEQLSEHFTEINGGWYAKAIDHRLTLRIPQWLMDKVDAKREGRVGSPSRNMWILEAIEQATKD